MEVEAVEEGTIGRIIVAAGTEGVKVNSEIAILLEEGEDASMLQPGSAAVATAKSAPASSGPQVSSGATQAPAAAPKVPAGNGRADGARLFISPLARRLAREAGLDPAVISGTGPHGRIVRRDVEAAQKSGEAKPQPAQAMATRPGPAGGPAPFAMPQPMPDDKVIALYEQGSYDLVPHDNMRKTIAKRLVESKVTIPHFYLSIDCRLDQLLAARERVNARAPKEGPGAYKLSVNDFIIKALALALRDVPAANATWTEQGMLRHKRIDVGVAVAVEGGLFTPVIRHADLKTLSEISNEMKGLAARARARKLAPHEYQGGTTSISNLGMYGIQSFDAVINPPHATILAVGAGEERAIVEGGKIVIANMMSCTLSCDHRVVDGALGATLLNAFKGYIEDPVRMLV
jgi:pyruvate dehydrogenase E2 component (dihydrolipoamide acetyltransferase)